MFKCQVTKVFNNNSKIKIDDICSVKLYGGSETDSMELQMFGLIESEGMKEMIQSINVSEVQIEPRLHQNEHTNYFAIAMPEMTFHLKEFYQHSYVKLSLLSACQIGIRITSQLKVLHNHGLLHLDVCPDALWVKADSHELYLMGFGSVIKFHTNDRKAYTEVFRSKYQSSMFRSKEGCLNRALSKRDDLESFLLTLLFLMGMEHSQDHPSFILR